MCDFYIGFILGVISTIIMLLSVIFVISSETFHYLNFINFIYHMYKPKVQTKSIKIISEKEISEEAIWFAKFIESVYKAKVSFIATEFDKMLKNYFNNGQRYRFDVFKLTRLRIVLDPNIIIKELNISHFGNEQKLRIRTTIDTKLSKILLNLILTIDLVGKSFVFIPLELEITSFIILMDFVIEYKENILTINIVNSDVNLKINYIIGSEHKLVTPINIDKLVKNCIQYLIVQNQKISLNVNDINDVFMTYD